MAKGKPGSKDLVPRKKVHFNGDDYELAIIGKGVDIPEREKIKIARVVCAMYATDKYTIAECLKHCGVSSENTWLRWRSEFEQIGDLYKEAQEIKANIYAGRLRERARTINEKLMEGYVVTLTEKVGEPVWNPETKETQINTVAIKEKQIYIRPSERLIEFNLVNLDGAMFQKSPEPHSGTGDTIPTDIRITIEGGGVDPVTEEDDILDIKESEL